MPVDPTPSGEPVLTALIVTFVSAVLSLLVSFGVTLTGEQRSGIVAVVTAVAALVSFFLARRAVTPNKNI